MNAHEKKKRLWKPCVTLEQLLAFDPHRPETATPSLLMNEVLASMFEICPLSSKALGEHMGVDHKKLMGAIELITGMPFAEIRELWAKHWYGLYKDWYPNRTQDQLAQAVGYADRSSLWNIFNRNKRRRASLRRKARYEYFKRMSPAEKLAYEKRQEEWLKKREEELELEREKRRQAVWDEIKRQNGKGTEQ